MKTNTQSVENTSRLSLTINPTSSEHEYVNTKKVYIVYSDRETTKLQEVPVTNIKDGKTKYIPEQFKLVQSIRLEFEEAPYKLDIFDGETNSENHIYLDENKQIWSASYYCYLDKDVAMAQLEHEHDRKKRNHLYQTLRVA